MIKRYFFIVNPTENEEKELLVKLIETVSEDNSIFEMEIYEGENFISTDEGLKVFLSEIATNYTGEGFHIEYLGLIEYEITYNLGKVISD